MRCILSAVVVSIAVCLLVPEAPAQNDAPPHQYLPAMLETLGVYRSGDYEQAQRMCLHVLSARPEADVRRDAAVIQAMCLLRSPARADQREGRARLAQLAEEDATFLNDPECNLAYGIAQTSLHETADALDAIARAIDGFAAAGQVDRQREALVALASCWARHGEWEETPARFDVPRPMPRGSANAVRRNKITAVRDRVEALGDEEAVARVDVVMARFLIEADAVPGEGLAILARLAAAPRLTEPAAEAALVLAEHYEQIGQWQQALRLYERIELEWHGEAARRAKQRMGDMHRPQIELVVPDTIVPGETVSIGLRVRGLSELEFEVREVDLETWLGAAGKRGNDAFLPESGSIRLARDIDTRPPAPHGWWDATALSEPLTFSTEPGALVVLARGQDTDGRVQRVKRLVVVSDLMATCVVGGRDVVLWATWRPGASEHPEAPATARFWMTRSFVPKGVTLEHGVAKFPLPNEAHIMRDKDWVCVVQAGKHVALCRGHLRPAGDTTSSPRQVAFVAGPATLSVGESLHVTGVWLPGRGSRLEDLDPAPLQVVAVDALEEELPLTDLVRLPGGVFTATLPITRELAGRHLRVLARWGPRTLDNILGHEPIRVSPDEPAPLRLRCDIPQYWPAGEPTLRGHIHARHPWGTPARGAQVRCRLRTAVLPGTGATDAAPLGVVLRTGQLDASGRFDFAVTAEELGLQDVARAVFVAADVTDLDGRTTSIGAEALFGPRWPHAWLTWEPPAPTAGDAVRFHAGWYQPGGRAVPVPQTLGITHDQKNIADLQLLPEGDGLATNPWEPPGSGEYTVRLSLAGCNAGETLKLEESVDVRPRPDAPSHAVARPLCTARLVEKPDAASVQVRLSGESTAPILVLIEATEPLAATAIDSLAGEIELSVPLAANPPSGLQVLVLNAGPDRPRVLAREPVQQATRPSNLRLEVPSATAAPASVTRLRVPLDSDEHVALMARLVPVPSIGYADRSLPPNHTARPQDGPTIVASTGDIPDSLDSSTFSDPVAIEDDTALIRQALSEGGTAWTTAVLTAEDAVDLSIPMPGEPGLYKLLAITRTKAGTTAVGACFLDTRQGLQPDLHVPARLTLGDRTQAALCIENHGDDAVDVSIRLNADETLHMESVHVPEQGPLQDRSQADGAAAVTVPAGESVWLRATIEAARPGGGKLAISADTAGHTHSAAAVFEVFARDESPEPTDGAVTVQRTVFVRDDDGRERELSADERLTVGQTLRVRDAITLGKDTHGMLWAQRLPPTCRAMDEKAEPLSAIGSRVDDRAGVVTYRVEPLTAGTHVHEFTLMVIRPGACALPAPRCTAGQHDTLIIVQPAELGLIVNG